jgi:hypothetical protein
MRIFHDSSLQNGDGYLYFQTSTWHEIPVTPYMRCVWTYDKAASIGESSFSALDCHSMGTVYPYTPYTQFFRHPQIILFPFYPHYIPIIYPLYHHFTSFYHFTQVGVGPPSNQTWLQSPSFSSKNFPATSIEFGEFSHLAMFDDRKADPIISPFVWWRTPHFSSRNPIIHHSMTISKNHWIVNHYSSSLVINHHWSLLITINRCYIPLFIIIKSYWSLSSQYLSHHCSS